MKILVVGLGFIGKNFAAFASEKFAVDAVNSRDGWQNHDFAGYSAVVFAAGFAHRRQSAKNAHMYFAVNRDLAVAVAEKGKIAGVPHFVYISSMAVFGKKEGEISSNTKPIPAHNDYYGTSKHQAESALFALQDDGFLVAAVRPPMVYGDDCPGKYRTLAKIAKFLPFVPCNSNQRGIIHISALADFLCGIIASGASGTFHPQGEIVSTSQLIRRLRNGKKTVVFRAKLPLRILAALLPPVKTAFGTLYYANEKGEPSK